MHRYIITIISETKYRSTHIEIQKIKCFLEGGRTVGFYRKKCDIIFQNSPPKATHRLF